MSFTDHLTDRINRLENFAANAPVYLLPVRLVAWLLIALAMLASNLVALLCWPFSELARHGSRPAAGEHEAGEIIEVTTLEELAEVSKRKAVVLVDVWAQWCGPCLLMNRALASIAERYAGEVAVVKVDASLGSAVSDAYAVRGLPTLILLHDGQEVARKSGALTQQQIRDLIDQPSA